MLQGQFPNENMLKLLDGRNNKVPFSHKRNRTTFINLTFMKQYTSYSKTVIHKYVTSHTQGIYSQGFTYACVR